MSFHLSFVCALLIFVFGASSSFAWNVTAKKGFITTDDGPVKLGMSIAAGKTIVTGEESKVRLKYGSSSFWIGENSKVTLPKNAMKMKGRSLTLKLYYGKFRARVKSKNEANIKYQTKSAVAGVRGTEFFIASDASGDSFCTLENAIDVTLGNGETIRVAEGKGLVLSAGEKPKLQDNSSFLVTQWVSETSIENEAAFINGYGASQFLLHKIKDQFYSGITAWTFYCDSKDMPMGQGANTKNSQCLNSTISPFLKLGKGSLNMYLRPAVYSVQASPAKEIDNDAKLNGQAHTQLALAEGYVSAELGADYQLKMGVQEVQWADGILLGKHLWRREPITHFGARVFSESFDVIITEGQKSTQSLDGKTHVNMQGAAFHFPGNWGSVYYLRQDFGNLAGSYSHTQKGHLLDNYGLTTEFRKGWHEWRGAAIFQNHSKHTNSAGQTGEADAHMLDVSVGIYPMVGKNFRLLLGYMNASENFFTAFEDYYQLGFSGIVQTRANLRQHRIQGDLRLSSRLSLLATWLKSYENSKEGMIRQTSAIKDGADIGQEFNLGVVSKVGSKAEVFVGGWSFDPATDKGSKTSSGLQARIQLSY